jgi:hypothetical protein
MSEGTVLLKDYPLPKVVMACDRGGRYDKTALIERLGGETRLPSLRLEIAAAGLVANSGAGRRIGCVDPSFTLC